MTPFLEAGLSAEEAKKVGAAFVQRIENEDDLKAAGQDVDEEDGEPLTDKPLKFSLAYGKFLCSPIFAAANLLFVTACKKAQLLAKPHRGCKYDNTWLQGTIYSAASILLPQSSLSPLPCLGLADLRMRKL